MPQNALDYITVKGFKSIRSIERLELRPVNVLVGANGSGKSNFIAAFEFLHAIREGELQKYVAHEGGAERLLCFGSKATQQIEIGFSWESERNSYELILAATKTDTLFPLEETAAYWNRESGYRQPLREKLYPREGGLEAGISDAGSERIAGWLRERLSRMRVYHFHDTSDSSKMRKTGQIHDNRFLRPDAANLAPFLYYLQRSHPNSYGRIRDTIRRVAPFFDDLRLAPLLDAPEHLKLEWKHAHSDAYFDAASLSDGTLRFMALATLFLQPPGLRPSTILVDEPELGLHPFAIELLASLIRHAAGETQVIAATQSPLLLDQFEPDEVLVADLVDGATGILRLDAAGLSEWLEHYSLGQLWEKNEIGGRPVRA